MRLQDEAKRHCAPGEDKVMQNPQNKTLLSWDRDGGLEGQKAELESHRTDGSRLIGMEQFKTNRQRIAVNKY